MSVVEDIRWLLTGDLAGEDAPALARVALRVLWKGGGLLFCAYALGGLTFLGVHGLAKADEVDRKIAAATVPMSAQLAQIKLKVDEQSAAAQVQAVQALTAAIIDAQVKKCRAGKAETAEIYRGLRDTAYAHYHELTHEFYPIPNCSDL